MCNVCESVDMRCRYVAMIQEWFSHPTMRIKWHLVLLTAPFKVSVMQGGFASCLEGHM